MATSKRLDNYTFETEQDGNTLFVKAIHQGKTAGSLECAASSAEPGKIYPLNLKVEPAHRRKGLATRMYELAEAFFGMRFKKGSYQSPEGKAFRQTYDRAHGYPKESLAVDGWGMPLMLEDMEQWNTGSWFHYSKLPEIKINPRQGHQDPAGIYLFPASFKQEGGWHNYPYKFKVKADVSSTLDLGHLDRKGAIDLYKALVPKNLHDLATEIEKASDPVDTMWELLKNHFVLQNNAPGKAAWNKAFRDLGYDSIFDDTGAIFTNEVQLLVLDPRKVKVIERLEQRATGFEEVKEVAGKLSDLLQSLAPDGYKVTAQEPKKQKPRYGGQPEIESTVSLTGPDPDQYLNWTVSTSRFNQDDAAPTEIRVKLTGGAYELRQKRGVGTSFRWNKKPWDFSELKSEVDLSIQTLVTKEDAPRGLPQHAKNEDKIPANAAQLKWAESGAEGIAFYDIPIQDFLKLTAKDQAEIDLILAKAKDPEFYRSHGSDMRVHPHLSIREDGQVVGHEGRHRAASELKSGETHFRIVLVAAQTGWPTEQYGWRWKRQLPVPASLKSQFSSFRHTVEMEKVTPIPRAAEEMLNAPRTAVR